MTILPPPTTFAEGQRALMVWLMAGAGVFAGIMVCAMIALFIWGGWAPANERLILFILAGALAGFVTSMIAVIIAMAVGGPVGRFKTSVTKDGVSLEAEGDG